MVVYVSGDLVEVVPVEEAQIMVDWFSGPHPGTPTEAFLVPVSGNPQDSRRKATSYAVLIIEYGAIHDEQYSLCYIYCNGDSPPAPAHLGEAPHICPLYGLDPDRGDHQKFIAEAREGQEVTHG